MKSIGPISIVIFTIFFFPASGQIPNLPHFRTNPERAMMEQYLDAEAKTKAFHLGFPTSSIRTMGEWEEVQAIVLAWQSYPDILTEIVRHAIKECQVIILTSYPDMVAKRLEAGNIPLERVKFLNIPTNSVWIRDYGPWAAYKNDVDSLVLIDWLYNRPRPDDDLVPMALAKYLDLPVYEASLTSQRWLHTGGNFLVDGMGTAFSSELVLNENHQKSESEMDQIAATFLGVQRYIKLATLPNDAIHHLDMHMRLLDEETILIGQYPEGAADGPQIEENIAYIRRNLKTPFGNPYRIVRVPMPPDQFGRYPDRNGYYRTYTNSIFINKTVLVPVYGIPTDSVALNIYQEYLPGYNIVGIDCNKMIPAFGALHCITKLIGTDDPLWMAHSQKKDSFSNDGAYEVRAKIKHKSGIKSATVFYREIIEDKNFRSLPMFCSSEDWWFAKIPTQKNKGTIQYFIEAESYSGKIQKRPMTAPDGYYKFEILSAETPPIANFFPVQTCIGQTVEIKDESIGVIHDRQWYFSNGQHKQDKFNNQLILYEDPGVYPVSLVVSNTYGKDSIYVKNGIQVHAGTLPFIETFSGGGNVVWNIENIDNDPVKWESMVGGDCRGESLVLDNFSIDNKGKKDRFYTTFDLRTFEQATLFFDVAYAPFDSSFYDGLRVNLKNCQGHKVNVYSKFGQLLATAPATKDAFIPLSCAVWRTESIDLSEYVGKHVTVEFENVGGYGNLLYLDNIEIKNIKFQKEKPLKKIPFKGGMVRNLPTTVENLNYSFPRR